MASKVGTWMAIPSTQLQSAARGQLGALGLGGVGGLSATTQTAITKAQATLDDARLKMVKLKAQIDAVPTKYAAYSQATQNGWTKYYQDQIDTLTKQQTDAQLVLDTYGSELADTGVPEFPAAPVTPLTGTEQTIQDQLQQLLGQPGLPESFTTAQSALAKILQGKTSEELLSGPAMQAMTSLQNTQAENARTAMIAQNRTNIGAGGLGRLMQLIEQNKTQNIATELGRQADLAQQAQLTGLGLAPTYASFEQFAPTQKLAGIESLAQLPRTIQQQTETAGYEAEMQKLLFPTQVQAPILQGLTSEQMYAYQPPAQTVYQASAPQNVAQAGGSSGLSTQDYVQMGMAVLAMLSDKRFKRDIKPIDNALEKIRKIEGKTYNYITSPDKRDGGLIAQELEEVLPESVMEVQGVKYVKFDAVIGLLVNAIKELDAKMLSARILR